MEHYTYKTFSVTDFKWDLRAKAIKKNKYFKLFRKHFKKIIGVTAMMSFALILKHNLHV